MFLSDGSYLQGTRSGLMRFIVGSAAILAAAGSTGGASAAPALTVLHSFTGYPDGTAPIGKLAMDSSGALYGTTSGGGFSNGGYGTVFKLTPPAAGKTQWTKTMLFAFNGYSDGRSPLGGVILDKSGALYGTTRDGGAYSLGTVFKLTPPAAGKTQWSYAVLHSFGSGNDGGNPWAGLIMDSNGALYGTTSNRGGYLKYGTVFKLTPPAAGKTLWTESVLYSFSVSSSDGKGPQAGLLMDSSGALYGTTYLGGLSNLGTIFKLTPPGAGKTQWTETVLYSFNNLTTGAYPVADLSMDSKEALYGTTGGGPTLGGYGTVFKLAPPAAGKTQWTETVLYNFNNGVNGAFPFAGVIFDSMGALYGTTSSGTGTVGNATGTVFKLTPPAAGKTLWTETVLYGFKNGTDGYAPESDLIFDKNGALYGTTTFGSSYAGAVFELH
ncbi:MAG: choice-of-anchor tandem repeat GloVer-containing protein [Methylocella sp.]